MEEILKSLQGKSITKKSLFDFLSEINLEKLSSDKLKNKNIYEDIVIYPIKDDQPQEKKRRGRKPKEKPVTDDQPQEKKRRGRKPKEKSVTDDQPQEKKRRGRKPKEKPVTDDQSAKNEDTIKLTKGIHLIINELLEKAITDNNILECKFCKHTFSTKGNLHKHFNTSTLCNIMGYDDFKNLIINYNT